MNIPEIFTCYDGVRVTRIEGFSLSLKDTPTKLDT